MLNFERAFTHKLRTEYSNVAYLSEVPKRDLALPYIVFTTTRMEPQFNMDGTFSEIRQEMVFGFHANNYTAADLGMNNLIAWLHSLQREFSSGGYDSGFQALKVENASVYNLPVQDGHDDWVFVGECVVSFWYCEA